MHTISPFAASGQKLRGRRLYSSTVAAASVLLLSASALTACGSSSKSSSSSTTTAGSSGATSPAGSTGSTGSGGAAKSVTVALIDPLSGALAPYGRDALNGAKAGAEYLNAGHAQAKNIHYVIESRDSQATPTVDSALARELTQSGIRFFIGDDLTDTGFAAQQPVFNRVHAVSFTSTPVVPSEAGASTPYPDVYGLGGSNDIYVTPIVDYLQKNGVKSLAIMYANYQAVAKWGAGAAAAAKQDGMTVSSVGVPLTATDVTAQLRQLKSSGASALLVYALTQTLGATVVQGLNQIGWAPSLSVLQGPTPQEVATLPANAQKNLVSGPTALTFMSPTLNAQPTGLVASYYQYYAPLAGETPGKFDSLASGGSYYFDAMVILDQAIAKAGSTDSAAVAQVLDSGNAFTGARGPYMYTATNRVGPPVTNFGLQTLTAEGCPTGICQLAPNS